MNFTNFENHDFSNPPFHFGSRSSVLLRNTWQVSRKLAGSPLERTVLVLSKKEQARFPETRLISLREINIRCGKDGKDIDFLCALGLAWWKM